MRSVSVGRARSNKKEEESHENTKDMIEWHNNDGSQVLEMHVLTVKGLTWLSSSSSSGESQSDPTRS